MTATDAFFRWYYTGFNGLGGWLIFALIAAAAVIWLFYDSSKRRLPAIGWRLAAILTASLLLPTIIYRFSSADIRDSLTSFLEMMFYIGLLGGLLPPVIAAGYYVTFQGMAVCDRRGHVYEAELGECPECARLDAAEAQPAYVAPAIQPATPLPPRGQEAAPPLPAKPRAHAWLIAEDGHSYQLNQGTTTVGKSSRNDVQIIGDKTLSRDHAKILEQNGRFKLHDLGSTNGSRVNGNLVREPVLLEPDDRLEFGDNTHVTFVTSRR